MKKLVQLLFIFLVTGIYCQSPDWSVNSSNFQHSMTFTVFLNVNGTTLTNANDKVGAFVNNENRGEANVVYNTNANKYLAYLTVYGITGEVINFKIYDSTKNQIVSIAKTQIFTINGNVGGVYQSFSIANPALSNNALLSDFSFKDVGSQTTINSSEVTVNVDTNTNVSNLIPIFTISNNGKFYFDKTIVNSGTSNFDFTNTLTFDVMSEDESTLSTYTITVTKTGSILVVTTNLNATSTIYNSNPISVKLVTSEEVNGISEENFETTNCIIHTLNTTDQKNYELNLITLSEGSFSLKLKENSISDTNKTNNASNLLTLAIDTNNPFIQTIKRLNPIDEIVSGNEVQFEIIFNEAVTNVTANDFITITNGVISVEKISDTTYHLLVSNLQSIKGIIDLQVSNTNDISDKAGNSLQITKIVAYEK